MFNQLKNRKDGFTIIEVVLVLAIAGLIFLIVFLAVPQLQQSRRDTQRRSDAGRIVAALENYASNNNGAYPTAAGFSTFMDDFFTTMEGTVVVDEIPDPTTGENYERVASSAEPGDVQYLTARTCNGDSFSATTGNIRQIALIMPLEGGGQACVDNS